MSVMIGGETVPRVMAALRQLHGQAHGRDPFKTCQLDPCRQLDLPNEYALGSSDPGMLPLIFDDELKSAGVYEGVTHALRLGHAPKAIDSALASEGFYEDPE